MPTNDNDDVDLYDDLPEFNLEATIEKLEAENKALTQTVKDLTIRVSELETQNNDLTRINKNLNVNISSLVKTAQGEIQRKDATIGELRQEREDLFFRRQKPAKGRSNPDEEQIGGNENTDSNNIKEGRPRRPMRRVAPSEDPSKQMAPDSSIPNSVNPAERRPSTQADAPHKPAQSDRRSDNSNPRASAVYRLTLLPGQPSDDDFQLKRPRRKKSSEQAPRRDSSASGVSPVKQKPEQELKTPETPTIAQTKEESNTASPKKRTRRTPTSRLYVKTRSSARISAKLQNSMQETSNDGADVSLLEALRLEERSHTLEERSQPAFSNSPLPDILSPFKDDRSMSPVPCIPSSAIGSLLTGVLKPTQGTVSFNELGSSTAPPPPALTPVHSTSPLSSIQSLLSGALKRSQSCASNGPPAKPCPPAIVSPLSESTPITDALKFPTRSSEPTREDATPSMPTDPRKVPSARDQEKAPKQVLRLGVLSYKEDPQVQKDPPRKENVLRPEDANHKDVSKEEILRKDALISNVVANKRDVACREETSRIDETEQDGGGLPENEKRRCDGEISQVSSKRAVPRKEERKGESSLKSVIGRKVEQKRGEGRDIRNGIESDRETPGKDKVPRREAAKLNEEVLRKEAERRKEDARCREEVSRKDEKRWEEAARRAEEGRKEEGRRKDEARRREEEHRKEDAKRKEEDRRKEEAKRREEEHRKEEAKRREEEHRKEESRRKEEERRKEEAKRKEEERRKEESRRKEEERRKEEAKRKEEERRKEEAKRREENFRKEEAKRREDKLRREEECRKEEVKRREENLRKEEERQKEAKRREEVSRKEEERRKEEAKLKEDTSGKSENVRKEAGLGSSETSAPKEMNGVAGANKNGLIPAQSVRIDTSVSSNPKPSPSVTDSDSSALQCDFKVRRRTRVQVRMIVNTPPNTPSQKSEAATMPPPLTTPTNKIANHVENKVGTATATPTESDKPAAGKVVEKRLLEAPNEIPSKMRSRSPRDNYYERVSPRGQFHNKKSGSDFRRRGRSRSRSPPRSRENLPPPRSSSDHRQVKVFRSPPPRPRISRKDDARTHHFNSARRSRSLSPRLYLQRKDQRKVERFELSKLPVDRKERERMLFGTSPDRVARSPPKQRIIRVLNVKRCRKTNFEDSDDSKELSSTHKPQSSSSVNRLLSTPVYFRERHPDSNSGESDSESGAFSSGTESSHSKDSDDSYRPKKRRKRTRTDNPNPKKMRRGEKR